MALPAASDADEDAESCVVEGCIWHIYWRLLPSRETVCGRHLHSLLLTRARRRGVNKFVVEVFASQVSKVEDW